MNVFDLMAKISLDTSDYEKELDGAEKKAHSKGKGIASGLASGIKTGAKVVAGATASIVGATLAGFNAIRKMGMSYNQEMEDYTTNFATMLGDEAKAVEKVNELKQFASSTPLSMADLAQGTQTLLAFGVANEETTDKLRQLGDIALGDAGKMQSLANAYGKASAQGKLSGEVVQSMISAGFNPLILISEKMGWTMEQTQKKMSEGAITVEMLDDALQTATSDGGQFAGGMEKASHTTTGLISTLQDNVRALAGLVSGSLSESFRDDLLPTALKTVKFMTVAFKREGVDMFKPMVNMISSVVGFISTHTRQIIAIFRGMINFTTKVIKTSAKIVKSVGKGMIKGLSSVMDALSEYGISVDDIINGALKMFRWLGRIVGEIFSGVGKVIGSFISAVHPLFTMFDKDVDKMGETTEKKGSKIKSIIHGIRGVFNKLSDGVSDAVGFVVGKIQWFKEQAETEGTPINTAINNIKKAFSGLRSVAKRVFGKIVELFGDLKQSAETDGTPIHTWIERAVELFKSLKRLGSKAIEKIQEVLGKLATASGEDGDIIETAFKGIKKAINGAFTIGSIVGGILIGVIDSITKLLDGDFSGAWENIKKTAKTAWEEIQKAVMNSPLGGLIERVKTVIDNVVGAFVTFKTEAGNAFAEAKKKATEFLQPIIDLLDKIKNGLATINPFSKNNLPANTAMELDGWGNPVGNYAKGYQKPLLLNDATIFGQSGGKSLMGGERTGAELVYGHDALLRDIANASGAREMIALQAQIIGILGEYFPQFAQGKTVSINGKALVGQIVNDMDEALGARAYRNSALSVRGV